MADPKKNQAPAPAPEVAKTEAPAPAPAPEAAPAPKVWTLKELSSVQIAGKASEQHDRFKAALDTAIKVEGVSDTVSLAVCLGRLGTLKAQADTESLNECAAEWLSEIMDLSGPLPVGVGQIVVTLRPGAKPEDGLYCTCVASKAIQQAAPAPAPAPNLTPIAGGQDSVFAKQKLAYEGKLAGKKMSVLMSECGYASSGAVDAAIKAYCSKTGLPVPTK